MEKGAAVAEAEFCERPKATHHAAKRKTSYQGCPSTGPMDVDAQSQTSASIGAPQTSRNEDSSDDDDVMLTAGGRNHYSSLSLGETRDQPLQPLRRRSVAPKKVVLPRNTYEYENLDTNDFLATPWIMPRPIKVRVWAVYCVARAPSECHLHVLTE